MKTLFVIALAVSALSVCNAADLPRSTPEAQGISSAAVSKFVEDADKKIDSMNSFMLVRHGQVVAEGWWAPYSAETPHVMHSLSKSFNSTAVGLAVADGKLSIDDEVLKFYPEDAPAEPSKNLKLMRVRDLLTMTSGHTSEAIFDKTVPWTKTFLSHPVTHKPGTFFMYNTPGSYMLSAIVQKATGLTELEYLRSRLFEPLGIKQPRWDMSPQGINQGGFGLYIRTEDIAKFGQFYLQKGQWDGKQLVPAAWVAMATARQTSNGSDPNSDWDQGYGFQFWRCRHNAFRGDGADGQFCIVMPDQDAVIAVTAGTRTLRAIPELVWDDLLPAMQPAALPANEDDDAKLQKTLSSLTIRKPEGAAAPPAPLAWAGKQYDFPSNKEKLEAIKLDLDPRDNTPTLTFQVNGATFPISCGYGKWEKSRMAYGSPLAQPVAACGAWKDDGSFVARLCFYESTMYLTLTLKPSGDELLYDSESNLRGKLPQLKGRMK